jgi:cell division GTPase FtsZ
MARERGILTVSVVTKPFDFEGPKRKKSADAGIEELQQFVDTLIVIPNQNLFRLANERTTFAEAFKMADNVLYMGVRGVTDLMVNPGLVNLDFADEADLVKKFRVSLALQPLATALFASSPFTEGKLNGFSIEGNFMEKEDYEQYKKDREMYDRVVRILKYM